MTIFELKSSDVQDEEADQERALIRSVQAGDRGAQEAIFRRYKDRIFSQCLRMTCDRAAAEDLTHDAFLTLFQKAQTFRGEAKFSSWFHRLASNLVISYLRRHKRMVFPDSGPDTEDAFPREAGARGTASPLDALQLQRALALLPDGYRAVFVLYELEQYTHEEIADMLGCSVSTSKTQLFKARKRLRELLS